MWQERSLSLSPGQLQYGGAMGAEDMEISFGLIEAVETAEQGNDRVR